MDNTVMFDGKDILKTEGDPVPVLEVVMGNDKGEIFELSERNVVGRGDDCDVTINDSLVSREHLRIEMEKDQFIIEDLNSTNGTFFKNDRIKKISVPSPAEIVMGKTKVVLKFMSGVKIQMERFENKRKNEKKEIFSLKNIIKN